MCSGWSGAARLALAAMLIALPASGGLAQTSLGGVDSSAPSQPLVAPAPAPAPAQRPSSPRMDYIPTLPDSSNRTPPQTPDSTDNVLWAAIGFTADGSYYSAWKYASKAEAEAQVAKKCSAYGRGFSWEASARQFRAALTPLRVASERQHESEEQRPAEQGDCTEALQDIEQDHRAISRSRRDGAPISA